MFDADLRRRRAIATLGPWFHNLHLPDGSQTAPDHPLGDFPALLWQKIASHVPEDLSGCSVLDIGCNAGFYSFELARRGAVVTAIDHDPHYLRQAEWAARQYGLSNITFRLMPVYDLARDDTTYDLVWFMGVNYHLRYPLLGLDIVARKVAGQLVYQTMMKPSSDPVEIPDDIELDDRARLLDNAWPSMAFIEKRLAGDPTNWWVANAACVEAMLRSARLKVVGRVPPEVYLCEPDKSEATGLQYLLDEEYLAATSGIQTARSSNPRLFQ